MFRETELVIAFIIAFAIAFLSVYPVKKLAIKIGAMDLPNKRKIHIIPVPRLGGLAIFLGVAAAFIYMRPADEFMYAIIIGAFIVILVGILDDKYQLRPIIKLAGQAGAAGILIASGLIIERINIPFYGLLELDYFSIVVTLLWIIGMINAINLIDGLDGLASGVSTIALTSILVVAIIDQRSLVIFFCLVLIASNLGFLIHNFYPAKIYMGDTGSMFLGYAIAVISIMGLFKNVTLFSFVIPIIILAIPIFDTLFTILRRAMSMENIMLADKKHIHYRILESGFSHVTTVLIIYGFSFIFGLLGIVFSNSSQPVSLLVILFFLLLLHLFAEIVGIFGKEKKPVLHLLGKLVKKKQGK